MKVNKRDELIMNLISIAEELRDIPNIKDDMQLSFISRGLDVILHAGQNPEYCMLMNKCLIKYMYEFGVLSDQISVNEYLISKEDILSN